MTRTERSSANLVVRVRSLAGIRANANYKVRATNSLLANGCNVIKRSRYQEGNGAFLYEPSNKLPLNQAPGRPLVYYAGWLTGQYIVEHLLQIALLHAAGYLRVVINSATVAHRKAAASWL